MRYALLFLFFVVSPSLWGQSATDRVLHDLVEEQGNPFYRQNRVTLLPSAREKYADLFAAVREARHFIHLEYFIFRQDSVGSELLNLLAEKAAQGVEVRLIIDAYGNYKSPCPMVETDIDDIRRQGIMIDFFDPIRFPWIPNMLHRDHRKIVVVDGKAAYTGGMNVADYYLKGTKRTGKWRDMQIRLDGPVVDEFERIFAKIWENTTGEHLDSLIYRDNDSSSVVSLSLVSDSVSQESGLSSQEADVVVVNREPRTSNRQMRQAFASAIDAAQSEVRIVNPYPTNVRMVRRAMRRALKRGVRMRLMVSGTSDNRVTPEVVAVQMKKFVRRGAEVYYYDGGFHHSKVMTIDGAFCNVGTVNFDGRSMRYDYEVSVFVFSPSTTAQLDAIFDADLRESEQLTSENFRRRFSLKRRFIGRVFQPLKSLL